MKEKDEKFEQYLEELTQEIIDAFTAEPNREPSSESSVTHIHGD